MILTCPACQTRYRVADAAMDPAGRDVRCAKCGNTWHVAPESGADTAASDPAIFDGPRLEPGIDAPPLPTGAVEPHVAARVRPGWVGLGWLALVLVLVAAIAGGALARNQIVVLWPAAARLYALAGFGIPPLGAGLEIRKVVPTRTADGLLIEGEIANIGATVHEIPRLRVALLDPGKKEIQYKIIDPPKDRLLPGEVTRFRAPFAQTDDAATKVAVTFASG